MAFKTYQCDKYISYLQAHASLVNDIYKLIVAAPHGKTFLGSQINMTYSAFHKAILRKSLTEKQLIKLLEVIK